MIQKNYFLLAILLAVIFCSAQKHTPVKTYAGDFYFGVKAGVAFANLTDTNQPNVTITHRTGMQVGAYGRYYFTDKLVFQPELVYSNQGNISESTGFTNKSKLIINFDYIVLPLMVKYYLLPKVAVEFGPQLSFLVNKDDKYEGFDSDVFYAYSSIHNNIKKMNDYDVALNAGLAFEWDNGIHLDARYSMGLITTYEGPSLGNFSETPDQNIRNAVFSVGLGYTFK